MKIYDCFTFYNEFELLGLRLKAYYDLVDYFVISESNKTFRGEEKPLYLKERLSEFEEYIDKIIYIEQESNLTVNKTGDYSIEYEQRNALLRGLNGCNEEDVIFLSDIDEFPSIEFIEKIRGKKTCKINKIRRLIRKRSSKVNAVKNLVKFSIKYYLGENILSLLDVSPVVLGQEHFYYFMDNKYPDIWCGTTITKYENVSTMQSLRDLRRRLPIIRGGYHFAYMGGIDRILKKINSTVDENPNRTYIRRYTIEDVKENLKKGSLMYDYQNLEENVFTQISYKELKIPGIVDFNKEYPQFFINNSNKESR